MHIYFLAIYLDFQDRSGSPAKLTINIILPIGHLKMSQQIKGKVKIKRIFLDEVTLDETATFKELSSRKIFHYVSTNRLLRCIISPSSDRLPTDSTFNLTETFVIHRLETSSTSLAQTVLEMTRKKFR